jgi:tetratricopeptide (TPR) repeat protein
MAEKSALIKEAQKYLEKGQIDRAIGEWEKIVREYPDGNNYNSIGDLYLKRSDKKNAGESYHKAANFFRQEGFSLKAVALFKKVLNLNPVDTAALYALGELSEEKELATDAIKYYLATADALSKEGKKNELFDIYSRILSLSPSNIPLRIKVAEILLKEGLQTDASKEYFRIAGLCKDKGDFQKSKEFYRKSLDLQPRNKDAVIGLSVLYEKSGETEKALDVMKEAAAIFSDKADVLFRTAELYFSSNDMRNAESLLSRAKEIDPQNARSGRLLGEIFLKQGLKEKAWEEYRILIDGLVDQEKFDEAVDLIDNLKVVEPIETRRKLVSIYRQIGEEQRIPEELTIMGDIFYDKGMRDKALDCYAEANERTPGNKYLQDRLAGLTGKGGSPAPVQAEKSMESPEWDKEADIGQVSEKKEKNISDIFVEADNFIRYGLLSEARELLEGFVLHEPENIDLHIRLKNVYADSDDNESAVTECLILNTLYNRSGDSAAAEKFLSEAYRISPSDPRLSDRVTAQTTPSMSSKEIEKYEDSFIADQPIFEDYEEDIAEADFYARQGLAQEALKILLKLQELFPENQEIIDRLDSLGEGGGIGLVEKPGMTNDFEEYERESPQSISEYETAIEPDGYKNFSGGPSTEFSADEMSSEEITSETESEPADLKDFILGNSSELIPENLDLPEEITSEAESEPADLKDFILGNSSELVPENLDLPEEITSEAESEPADYESFTVEDISISEQDIIEAQEVPEPQLEDDVLEIFTEFKKGLESELEDEDSETHYNLGIAYKEMGLIDDAIQEFQTARQDKKRFLQSSSMLGVCYMEKGLFSLAVDVLLATLDGMEERNESYWSIKYDLAEAYEKNSNYSEALGLYTEVYGWNARFRDISEKISLLKTRGAINPVNNRAIFPKGRSGSRDEGLISRDERPNTRDDRSEPRKEKTKERKDRISYL